MDQGKDYPGTLGEYMERNISAVNMVDTAYTYANSAICYILDGGGSVNPRKGIGASDHPIENIKTIEVYDGNLRAWIVRNIDSNYGYYPPSDPTSDFYSMRHLHDAVFRLTKGWYYSSSVYITMCCMTSIRRECVILFSKPFLL